MSPGLDGLRPAQSAPHALSATLGWAPARGPRLSMTVRHTGAQFEDDLETDILPAATTLDAVAQLPVGKHVTLIGRAENVLDAGVVTRNVGGSIDLGTPRRLWIGLAPQVTRNLKPHAPVMPVTVRDKPAEARLVPFTATVIAVIWTIRS